MRAAPAGQWAAQPCAPLSNALVLSFYPVATQQQSGRENASGRADPLRSSIAGLRWVCRASTNG